MFPALSSPTVVCGGGCGREGRKYKEPSSTRRKGKRIGRFPKLPSKILPGGKRALPPPGRPGLRAFLSSLLGSGGVGSDRPQHLSGTQSPHQHYTEDFPGISSVPAPSATPGDPPAMERGLARGRRRPTGSGTASLPRAPPTPLSGCPELGARWGARQEAPATACFNVSGSGEEIKALKQLP